MRSPLGSPSKSLSLCRVRRKRTKLMSRKSSKDGGQEVFAPILFRTTRSGTRSTVSHNHDRPIRLETRLVLPITCSWSQIWNGGAESAVSGTKFDARHCFPSVLFFFLSDLPIRLLQRIFSNEKCDSARHYSPSPALEDLARGFCHSLHSEPRPLKRAPPYRRVAEHGRSGSIAPREEQKCSALSGMETSLAPWW